MKKLATAFPSLIIAIALTPPVFAIGYDFSACAGTFGDKIEEFRRIGAVQGDEEARRAVRIDHLYHVWQKSVAIEFEWWTWTFNQAFDPEHTQLAQFLEIPANKEKLGGWQRKHWHPNLVAKAKTISTLQREFNFFRLLVFQNLDEKYVPLDNSIADAGPEQIKAAALSAVSEIAQIKEFAEDEDMPDYIDIDTHAQPLFPIEFETTDPVELSKAEEILQVAEELSATSQLPEHTKEWLRQGVKFFRDLGLTPNIIFINATILIEQAEDLNSDN